MTPGRAADASSDSPGPPCHWPSLRARLQNAAAAAAAGCTAADGRWALEQRHTGGRGEEEEEVVDDGTFTELLTPDTRVSNAGSLRDNIALTAL